MIVKINLRSGKSFETELYNDWEATEMLKRSGCSHCSNLNEIIDIKPYNHPVQSATKILINRHEIDSIEVLS